MISTALLTAFYMRRQVFMVFFGEARWDRPLAEAVPELAAEREAEGLHEGHGIGPAGEIHPHESGWHMTLPLVILSVLAVVGGALNVPMWEVTKYLEHWLYPVIHFAEAHPHVATGTKIGLAAVATAAAVAGLLGAAAVYLKGRRDLAATIEKPILRRAWGYDAAIASFMAGPGTKLFEGITTVDKTVVDGAVNGVGTLVGEASSKARLLQTGYIRNYALGLTVGVVVVAGILLSKAVF